MSAVKEMIKPPLPGFEGVYRYWDSRRQSVLARVQPGEFYVTREDEAIVTTLGSCISVCIRDTLFNVGGMNHFLLPDYVTDNQGKKVTQGESITRYGNHAMTHLIQEVLRHGSSKRRLEIKVFGGGNVLETDTDVGQRNIEFLHSYIEKEGLSLAAECLGDRYPRKVVYYPATGKAMVKKLYGLHKDAVKKEESDYLYQIEHARTGGRKD